MLLLPKCYMRTKTGKNSYWKKWEYGYVSDKHMLISIFKSVRFPQVGNIYALAFEQIQFGLEYYPSWDAENGWLTDFLDSEINNATLKITVEFNKSNDRVRNLYNPKVDISK